MGKEKDFFFHITSPIHSISARTIETTSFFDANQFIKWFIKQLILLRKTCLKRTNSFAERPFKSIRERH